MNNTFTMKFQWHDTGTLQKADVYQKYSFFFYLKNKNGRHFIANDPGFNKLHTSYDKEFNKTHIIYIW